MSSTWSRNIIVGSIKSPIHHRGYYIFIAPLDSLYQEKSVMVSIRKCSVLKIEFTNVICLELIRIKKSSKDRLLFN